MKRKAENILTWIGVGLQGVLTVILTLLTLMVIFGSAVAPSNTDEDQSGIIFFIIITIISWIILIIPIIAGLYLKKNIKVTGVLLIVAGVVSIIGNIISAILWLIAGIMLLVRKPTQSPYENNYSDPIKSEKDNDPFEKDIIKQSKNDETDEKDGEKGTEDPFKY